MQPPFGRVEISKRGRFWAVHADGELVAVVVHKKGALQVKALLESIPSAFQAQDQFQAVQGVVCADDRVRYAPDGHEGA